MIKQFFIVIILSFTLTLSTYAMRISPGSTILYVESPSEVQKITDDPNHRFFYTETVTSKQLTQKRIIQYKIDDRCVQTAMKELDKHKSQNSTYQTKIQTLVIGCGSSSSESGKECLNPFMEIKFIDEAASSIHLQNIKIEKCQITEISRQEKNI